MRRCIEAGQSNYYPAANSCEALPQVTTASSNHNDQELRAPHAHRHSKLDGCRRTRRCKMEGKLKLRQLIELLQDLSHGRKADWVQKKRDISSRNGVVCMGNKPFLYLERQDTLKNEVFLTEAPLTRQGKATQSGLPGVTRGRGTLGELEVFMTISAVTMYLAALLCHVRFYHGDVVTDRMPSGGLLRTPDGVRYGSFPGYSEHPNGISLNKTKSLAHYTAGSLCLFVYIIL